MVTIRIFLQNLNLDKLFLKVKSPEIYMKICTRASLKGLNTNLRSIFWYYRSSHQKCSMKKGVLRNFGKFKGKHLCYSLCFNKVADLLYEHLRTTASSDIIYLKYKFEQIDPRIKATLNLHEN